ncbi:MAG: hypothetical protein K2I74_08545, partial [Treponemataceae bacterium]|nr:hypothetical protein [Treponemataceae bacterium]
MEAGELYLGEGKPSTSEAGFSLSQTSQGVALLNEFCFAKLALTLSQHGLGLHPKTPLPKLRGHFK